jgi:hypothetical protein
MNKKLLDYNFKDPIDLNIVLKLPRRLKNRSKIREIEREKCPQKIFKSRQTLALMRRKDLVGWARI